VALCTLCAALTARVAEGTTQAEHAALTTAQPTTETVRSSTTTTTTTAPPPTAIAPLGGDSASQAVAWTCTGTPCTWGRSVSGNAVAWPSTLGPTGTRLGYTTSVPIYLPATAANGMTISVTSGSAALYAGAPDARTHRRLSTAATGETFTVSDLSADEVLSVQNDATPFSIHYQPSPTTVTPAPAQCSDPLTCSVVTSVYTKWRCNAPACTTDDWGGGTITWPAWAAHADNQRTGDSARVAYNADTGEPVYPYMGSWANGCTVQAVHNYILIIEWKRGAEIWRATHLSPGESYTIHLRGDEDGALIETPDTWTQFAVSFSNCTPRPVAKP
jgi:hypothetical protein